MTLLPGLPKLADFPVRTSSEISDPQALSLLELFLVVHVTVMIILTSWGYAFASNLAQTAVLVWAIPGLVITAMDWIRHRHNERGGLVFRVLSVLPILYFLVTDVLGRYNPAFTPAQNPGDPLLLNFFNPFLPVNGAPSESLGRWALYSGIYLTAINVLWVAKRRRTLRPFLIWGTLNASFLAFLGLLQGMIKLNNDDNVFANRLLFVSPSPNPTFFSSFAQTNQWTIFAGLWIAALGVTLSFPVVTPHGEPPAHRFRWLLRPLFIPLLASTYIASPLLFVSLILLIMGCYWVELGRFVLKFTGGKSTPYGKVLFFVTIGLVAMGGGLFYGVSTLMGTKAGFVQNLEQLISDGWKMAEASPIFGWGPGSYPAVHELFKQDDLWQVHHTVFPTTWMSLLIETGWVGLVVCLATPAFLFFNYLRQNYGNPMGNVLLLTCFLALILGFVENITSHPAVILSLGILLIIGYRHGQLGQLRREGWDMGSVSDRASKRSSEARKQRRRRSEETTEAPAGENSPEVPVGDPKP